MIYDLKFTKRLAVWVLLGFALVMPQSATFGLSKALYWTPLSVEPIQVGGSPLIEWENKLSPNSTASLQFYYDNGHVSDWFEPDNSTDLTLAGIGGGRKWYLGGEAFSGGYVGLGGNLKAFKIQRNQSGRLTSQGSGLFLLLSFEAGYTWQLIGPFSGKVFMLDEQAFGLALAGSAGSYIGDQIAFGLKIGASFD